MSSRLESRTALTVPPDAVEQAGEVSRAALNEVLPPELADVMSAALAIIARGGTVTMGALPGELTTNAAADLLDISRPTLMKLIKGGSLPSYKVGSHTRLRSSDVLAYLDDKREQQRKAFAELRDFEDEIGHAY